MRKETDKLILKINSNKKNTANSNVFLENYAALFLSKQK
jgi:hypothetical protein